METIHAWADKNGRLHREVRDKRIYLSVETVEIRDCGRPPEIWIRIRMVGTGLAVHAAHICG